VLECSLSLVHTDDLGEVLPWIMYVLVNQMSLVAQHYPRLNMLTVSFSILCSYIVSPPGNSASSRDLTLIIATHPDTTAV
jgi:hypothetical protein